MCNFIEKRIKSLLPHLNERQRRIYLATEAESLGYGGISEISRLSGVSRVTITQGFKDLKQKSLEQERSTRCRKKGGGRKKVTELYPNILNELKALVEACTKGNPENPLLWTSKSVRKLQSNLTEKGIEVCHRTICDLLKELGYSLQSNRKS